MVPSVTLESGAPSEAGDGSAWPAETVSAEMASVADDVLVAGDVLAIVG